MEINKKSFLIVILFFYAIGNALKAQTNNHDDYINLQLPEYNEIVNSKAEGKLNGSYYITDVKKGVIKYLSIKKYKKGLREGEWIGFSNAFGNFKQDFSATYKNNKLDGYYLRTDNHTFLEKGYYKKGEKDGIWIEEKEGVEETITYTKGVLCGNYNSNNTNDNILTKGKYKKGKKVGVWVIKDKITGKVTKQIFKKGELITSED